MIRRKSIITVDALVDYIICPLRYAFLWHYQVSPPGGTDRYQDYLRACFAHAATLAHDRKLNYKTLTTALSRIETDLPAHVRGAVHGAVTKYAVAFARGRMVGYQVPVRRQVGNHVFAGQIDAIHLRDGVLRCICINDLPSAIQERVGPMFVGVLQHCMSADITDTLHRRNIPIKWISVRLVGSELSETSASLYEYPRSIMSAVARGIQAQSFYPRGHRGICRSCGFSNVCGLKWCSTRALLRSKTTATEIQRELEA